ncbi:MAG: hypothetical protein HXS54_13385 [Theionarchaea archaeon]|nr:hypothetical protein [Theionarchaea archaeon]
MQVLLNCIRVCTSLIGKPYVFMVNINMLNTIPHRAAPVIDPGSSTHAEEQLSTEEI